MGDREGEIPLVDEATGIFARNGARVDEAFALHVRARIEGETDAGDGSSLERYGGAIAALESAGAEYRLGVAHRQRANLHQRRGRREEACRDLARARSCFESVGATEERAEAEQAASAISAS
jgi:hypothetical protein